MKVLKKGGNESMWFHKISAQQQYQVSLSDSKPEEPNLYQCILNQTNSILKQEKSNWLLGQINSSSNIDPRINVLA